MPKIQIPLGLFKKYFTGRFYGKKDVSKNGEYKNYIPLTFNFSVKKKIVGNRTKDFDASIILTHHFLKAQLTFPDVKC